MASFKQIFLVFLTLALGALSINLNYSCKYTQGLGGASFTQRAAGSITDSQASNIVANMFHWSQGEFNAAQSTPQGGNTPIVTVTCVHAVRTKGEASGKLDAMSSIVNANKGA